MSSMQCRTILASTRILRYRICALLYVIETGSELYSHTKLFALCMPNETRRYGNPTTLLVYLTTPFSGRDAPTGADG